jgi:hypothetical protein
MRLTRTAAPSGGVVFRLEFTAEDLRQAVFSDREYRLLEEAPRAGQALSVQVALIASLCAAVERGLA